MIPKLHTLAQLGVRRLAGGMHYALGAGIPVTAYINWDFYARALEQSLFLHSRGLKKTVACSYFCA